MKGKNSILTVLALGLVVSMFVAIPVSAAGPNKSTWKDYQALAKSYGCTISLSEGEQAAFCTP